MQIKKEKKKKISKIFSKIFKGILFLIIIYNILFLFNKTIFKNEYIHFGDFAIFSIKDDLMEKDLNKYDLIISRKIKNSEELKVNDIIIYEKDNNIFINKVIDIENKIITKYNKSYYPNLEKVDFSEIIGEKIFRIPILGNLLNIMESNITGILIIIFLCIEFLYNFYKNKVKTERILKKEKFKRR